ncbi:MAG: Carbohydrate binding module (family 6) [Planctomycetes bacterium ADurb.Bin126]|nr:MAG: Carbohydrate binding module (family 6) [Planctomycetes bacterium ADurb.Bin126]HOD82425.1 hypothetical protein [Phycisphaerae bacterium]HQL76531.1 hypothetical protein [Phycisphaerae bacterium]
MGKRCTPAAFALLLLLAAGACMAAEPKPPVEIRAWVEAEDFVSKQCQSDSLVRIMYPASGGRAVGNGWGNSKGDWLKYNIDLPRVALELWVTLRVARLTAGGAELRLVLDGKGPGVRVSVPTTYGWGRQDRDWQYVQVALASVSEGKHTLEIHSERDNGAISLDGFLLSMYRVKADKGTSPAVLAGKEAPSDKARSDDEARVAQVVMPTSPLQAAVNRKYAEALAEKGKQIAPALHLIETPHFLIYSSWSPGQDKALSENMEGIYSAMLKQFALPPQTNVWAGKCVLYVFWEKSHYQAFATRVMETDYARAAGFQYHRGHFVCIVIGNTPTRDWFYEILVHESSHAFLARYINPRPVPDWINEGIAETLVCDVLEPKGVRTQARNKLLSACRTAVRERRDISHVFKEVRLVAYDYGLAQGLVQFLIASDRRAFITMVRLIKQGKSDEEALREAYSISREQLAERWLRTVADKSR